MIVLACEGELVIQFYSGDSREKKTRMFASGAAGAFWVELCVAMMIVIIEILLGILGAVATGYLFRKYLFDNVWMGMAVMGCSGYFFIREGNPGLASFCFGMYLCTCYWAARK